MTASKYIKSQGLPTLTFVAKEVDKPPQTIDNWYKAWQNNPRKRTLELVVKGLLYERENDE